MEVQTSINAPARPLATVAPQAGSAGLLQVTAARDASHSSEPVLAAQTTSPPTDSAVLTPRRARGPHMETAVHRVASAGALQVTAKLAVSLLMALAPAPAPVISRPTGSAEQTERSAKDLRMGTAVLRAASVGTLRISAAPAARVASELAQGLEISPPMAPAERTERYARVQSSATAAHQAAFAGAQRTSVVPAVRPDSGLALRQVISQPMGCVTRTARRARGLRMGTAARQPGSAAKPPTSAAPGVNLHSEPAQK